MISPELLRRYPFFGQIDDEQLRTIAMLTEEVSFSKGDTILEAGKPADRLYFLIDGCIDLHYAVPDPDEKQPPRRFYLESVNPGEPFGLGALVEPYRYTATIDAHCPSRVLQMDAAALRSACKLDPGLNSVLIRHVARTIMERLQDTRAQLAAARA